jgi:ATP-dependent DNA helicase RecG
LGQAERSISLGQEDVSGQLNRVIRVLLAQGLVEYTMPDKPNSRLQTPLPTPTPQNSSGFMKSPG